MSQTLANACALILGLVLILFLLMALNGQALPLPPEWLLGWTSWLGSAITVVLAPVGVGAAAHALHRWALKN